MYFVSERYQNKDYTQIPTNQRIRILLCNVYVVSFVVLDLLIIKNNNFSEDKLEFTGLYTCLGFFVVTQAYGFYLYCSKKVINQSRPEKQVSMIATILWHTSFFFKIAIFGLCLSSTGHQLIPAYFFIRFTVYAISLFLLIGHLRVIKCYIIRKDQYKSIYHQYGLWQLSNFHKILYASLIGITIDVISFGNDINYYMWLVMTICFSIYLIGRIMTHYHGWKFLKLIFDSQ